jgi:hypothetical protein
LIRFFPAADADIAPLLFHADDAVDLAVIHEMADLVVTEAAFGALEKEDRHGLPHAFAGSSLVSKRQ